MSKGYGKPKVGGPFVLKDLDGNDYTHDDMKGKYAIVSLKPSKTCGGERTTDMNRSTLDLRIVLTSALMSWTSCLQRSISSMKEVPTPSDHSSFRLIRHEIHLRY